jgi:hypothetical protein
MKDNANRLLEILKICSTSKRQRNGRDIRPCTEEKMMSNTKTQSANAVDKREDVNPAEGEHRYGEVEFADPTNKKYPIDSPEHVRAAWQYINHKDNAAKYEAADVTKIKGRIKQAAKKHGVEISEEE